MSKTISSLIPSQLPSYVREEFPTFVTFLESYYEFLELEKNPQDILTNLRQYTDIDDTLDEFVTHFQQQYMQSLPPNLAADKRLLAKHIQDLYRTKGTEKSFRLLFRILFNEDIELYYPKNNILKTSDGKWVQQRSLQISPVSGDVYSLTGSTIRVQNASGLVTTLVDNVVELVPGKLYEVFISNNYRGSFSVGDVVIGVSFTGKIMPTITGFTIQKPGTGFRPGQIFEIISGGGRGTNVKVTRVDSNGGITGLSLMTFGSGYVTDFYATLSSASPDTGTTDPYTDNTDGYGEAGYVTKADYFGADYSTPDYSAIVIGQFGGQYHHGGSSAYNDADTCVIAISIGALAKYPGYYSTTDGFLSDVNAIHDGDYYQNYSYVIKSQHRLDEYKKIVKEVLHPAGMKMFGEYQIVNDFDLGDFLEYDKVVLKNLAQLELVPALDQIAVVTGKSLTPDTFGVSELVQMLTSKTFTETPSPTDSTKFNVQPLWAETPSVSEQAAFSTTKPLNTDTYSTSDTTAFNVSTVWSDLNTSTMDSIASVVSKILGDTVSTTDSTSMGFSTTVPDSVGTDDSGFNLIPGKEYDDTSSTTDTVAMVTGRSSDADIVNAVDSQAVLNTGKTVQDSVPPTDSGSVLLANYAVDYSVVDYCNTQAQTF